MGYFRDNGHDISEDEFCDAYNQTGTFSEKNCTFWSDGILLFKFGSNEKWLLKCLNCRKVKKDD
ncbi:hypothetical protein [Butyrivibrio fibrisolvens]|uniref:hypothetical protein n=1 Tax=Butyrivibrio fibrisolvens TaxID=831 RepID=UPI0020BF5D56|nr:hypothetical protein [Butyrivibrio fibrisolvens]